MDMDQLKQRLSRAFWFALAVLFLVESWLWDNVKLALVWLAHKSGLKDLEPRARAFIGGLSPVATVGVFALPALAILPLKLMAVAAIAHGHLLTGLAVILGAKTLALGVTSFLFDASREKLMQLAWFVHVYQMVLRVSAWAHGLVDPVRRRLREARAYLAARFSAALGEGRSEFLRRVSLLRALVRRRGAS
jgi:hypothetical protein